MVNKILKFDFAINTTLCLIVVATVSILLLVSEWIPCPLCLLQQFCVVIILTLSLTGIFIKKPKYVAKILLAITVLISLIGTGLAAKQIHLQYYPTTQTTVSANKMSGCDAITNTLLIDMTKSIAGSIQSCSSTEEKISGVTLACYSFAFFIFTSLINIVFLLRRLFHKN